MLHVNQSLCPFDRILCEQTALSHELSPFFSGGRPNQFQVLDYSELAGTRYITTSQASSCLEGNHRAECVRGIALHTAHKT